MAFIIRTDRLPLVEVDYPTRYDELEFRAMFADFAALSAKHPRLAYIVDMQKFSPLGASARERKAAAAIFHEHAPRMVGSIVCEARIVSSEVTRCILTAFDWLTGTKWPCATFTSRAAAESWVRGRMSVVSRPRATALTP